VRNGGSGGGEVQGGRGVALSDNRTPGRGDGGDGAASPGAGDVLRRIDGPRGRSQAAAGGKISLGLAVNGFVYIVDSGD